MEILRINLDLGTLTLLILKNMELETIEVVEDLQREKLRQELQLVQ